MAPGNGDSSSNIHEDFAACALLGEEILSGGTVATRASA